MVASCLILVDMAAGLDTSVVDTVVEVADLAIVCQIAEGTSCWVAAIAVAETV